MEEVLENTLISLLKKEKIDRLLKAATQAPTAGN